MLYGCHSSSIFDKVLNNLSVEVHFTSLLSPHLTSSESVDNGKLLSIIGAYLLILSIEFSLLL